MVHVDRLRLFTKGDGLACHAIFMDNLAKYYGYLSPAERAAMVSVNTPAAFEEMAQRKNDRVVVVEREGQPVGYFHFGKEGKKIRIKRIQMRVKAPSLLSEKIFPFVETYLRKWHCASIVGDAAPHIVSRLSRVPGMVVGRETTRKVAGQKIGFVSLKYVSPARKRVRKPGK